MNVPFEASSHSRVQSGVLVYSSLDLRQLNSRGGAFPAAPGAERVPDGGAWVAQASSFQGSGTAHDTSFLDGELFALQAWVWGSLKLDPCGFFSTRVF